MSFINNVLGNWWQFAIAFTVVCSISAIHETRPLSKETILAIAKDALAFVIAFVFLTYGHGCSSSGTTAIDGDCQPSGPGIYNDC